MTLKRRLFLIKLPTINKIMYEVQKETIAIHRYKDSLNSFPLGSFVVLLNYKGKYSFQRMCWYWSDYLTEIINAAYVTILTQQKK